jgi:tRNA pseudouridine38-40 synthase
MTEPNSSADLNQTESITVTPTTTTDNDQNNNNKRQRVGGTSKSRANKKGNNSAGDGYERRWGTRPEKAEGDTVSSTEGRSEPRQPKRKVVVLMGFCGTGYQGMQM